MTEHICKHHGCDKLAWYVVSRLQGAYYAVRITEGHHPLYCEEHAHVVADRRARRIPRSTSAHVTLQDHEEAS